MVDFFIETSKSDRARCKKCGRTIGKDTPRGVITTKQNYGDSNYYYCYKCAKLEIKEKIENLKVVDRELEREIKQKSKEIILMELKERKK